MSGVEGGDAYSNLIDVFSMEKKEVNVMDKEDNNMNMLTHIFSFKLVLAFALVAFLGAVPKSADARRKLVTCPCPFATLYAVSIGQAKSLGQTN
jgi:hypothetical protein